ncbi:putative Fusaric acid resistance protein like [Trypanosoma vivax]|uniref:Integral membrane bound transporter domain-containing protein n=1 Tax=Trypanosoma vivax (strain Y486) TaxID=1055687 RepID=G0TXJ8_TRYVY|nr:hypothetical protein TRVL_02788 [Trypanosoma vivax]KAH8612565.1 putative Fusaric acid resistance protein like [Trypanosoma vivax]CCC48688.1 conserved hypothetical protein [Trypanosoma vivax Y486]
MPSNKRRKPHAGRRHGEEDSRSGHPQLTEQPIQYERIGTESGSWRYAEQIQELLRKMHSTGTCTKSQCCEYNQQPNTAGADHLACHGETPSGAGNLVDSFGLQPYEPLCSKHEYDRVTETESMTVNGNSSDYHARNGNSCHHGSRGASFKSTVPWQLREGASDPTCNYFSFLGTKKFWSQMQFSLRLTLVGMLIPCVLIAVTDSKPPFHGSMYAPLGVLAGGGDTFGRSASYLIQFLKSACIWLPVATVCQALQVERSFVVWAVIYLVVLFLVASSTENVTRKVCLLLFNIAFLQQLLQKTDIVAPTRLMVDWLIGALFAVGATLFPYPQLSTKLANKKMRFLHDNAVTAFRGLVACLWATTNLERSMMMIRVRYVMQLLDTLLDEMRDIETFAAYELIVFGSFEKRELRQQKLELLDKLRLNMLSMMRVIDIVQDHQDALDELFPRQHFRTSLMRPMENIIAALEELLEGLANAHERRTLSELDPLFEACGRTVKRLQDDFSESYRAVLPRLDSGRETKEFVSLVTSFLFTVVNFWQAIDEFHHCVVKGDKKSSKPSWRCILGMVTSAVVDFGRFVWSICHKPSTDTIYAILDAAKVSIAMLISTLFFYFTSPHSFLSGPTIIAYVSGVNPVEAVKASLARLIGTILGSVIGFFAASFCTTSAHVILSICISTAVMTFFRNSEKYGAISVCANFVIVSSLSLENITTEHVVSRIQQNTFAIIVYCLICVNVVPVSPTKLLVRKRIGVLSQISAIVGNLIALYNDPLLGSSRDEHGNDHQQRWYTWEGSLSRDMMLGPFTNELWRTQKFTTDRMRLRTFITVPEPDARICAFFEDVSCLREDLRVSAAIMPLAADEPDNSCEHTRVASYQLQSTLYRIFVLVYVMVCGWKLMRDKGYFTPEVHHLLHYLQPVVHDIRLVLRRFMGLLSFYLTHTSCPLGPELVKCLTQLHSLMEELRERTNQAILMTMSDTTGNKQQSGGTESKSVCAMGSGDGPPGSNVPNRAQGSDVQGVYAINRGKGLSEMRREVTASTLQSTDQEECTRHSAVKRKKRGSGKRSREIRPTTAPSPTKVPFGEVESGEDRNAKYFELEIQDPLHLDSHQAPASSQTPGVLDTPDDSAFHDHATSNDSVNVATSMTILDVEGLHAITLSLELMGKELKNVLLSSEIMVARQDG